MTPNQKAVRQMLRTAGFFTSSLRLVKDGVMISEEVLSYHRCSAIDEYVCYLVGEQHLAVENIKGGAVFTLGQNAPTNMAR